MEKKALEEKLTAKLIKIIKDYGGTAEIVEVKYNDWAKGEYDRTYVNIVVRIAEIDREEEFGVGFINNKTNRFNAAVNFRKEEYQCLCVMLGNKEEAEEVVVETVVYELKNYVIVEKNNSYITYIVDGDNRERVSRLPVEKSFESAKANLDEYVADQIEERNDVIDSVEKAMENGVSFVINDDEQGFKLDGKDCEIEPALLAFDKTYFQKEDNGYGLTFTVGHRETLDGYLDYYMPICKYSVDYQEMSETKRDVDRLTKEVVIDGIAGELVHEIKECRDPGATYFLISEQEYNKLPDNITRYTRVKNKQKSVVLKKGILSAIQEVAEDKYYSEEW